MKHLPSFTIAAFAVFLASACSNTGPRQLAGQTADQFQYQTTPYSGGTGASPSGTDPGSSDPDPSTDPSTSTGVPPLSLRVGTIGYNAVSVTVDVRSVLKVRFAPGVQDEVVQGTGYVATYSRLGVYIQVGSNAQATEMLSNGLLDGSPQKSRVIDFSAAANTGCAADDTGCHAPVKIQIFKPNNDYFCMNFGTYCPWAGVYSTHPWHGTLYVQTDDTDSI